MLIGKGIYKTYNGDPVLTDIEFRLGNNIKVGLVGRNGCGKTTLMKIISGVENVTEGIVEREQEVIGYLPQEIVFPKNTLVGEYLEQFLQHSWEFYLIESLVDQVQFSNFDQYQDISTLSEGQKMKLKMIEILLQDPTLVLIDEPTNHLDIEGIYWFENYIKELQKTVLMISHDRQFLNNTVDEIWEIENHQLIRFVGDYDNYKEEKLKLIDKWDSEYKLFLKKKEQLDKLLENARKIKDGKKRGRAINSVKKRIDREIVQNEKTKYEEKKIKKVEFETDNRSGKLMVRFDEIEKTYGDNIVFKDMDFEIRGKEKIWLFGPNGAGKSTIVKLIMEEEKPTIGDIVVGNNLRIGYFAQKQTHLDFEKNIQEHFIELTKCSYGESFGALKKFLFEGEALKKRVKNLSPGERARFAFAIFANEDYDMLILDEPTNHLDIETKEAIENSLKDYEGTLLLVSHDRYFVERVGINKRLNLRNGCLEWI